MRNRAKTLIRFSCLSLVLIGSSGALFADGTNSIKLPPPATNSIDFARDIRPILDNSCIRCHGPEKPKSRFRLDNRDAALKGGDKGLDIIPGDSGKSLLIRYVAYQEEDMEMPPVGKGDQLTADQVAKLRAWIDQGAKWDDQWPTNNSFTSATLLVSGTGVVGDAKKYREHYWQRTGANGGLEEFELFDDSEIPGMTVRITGHALADDYKVVLAADKADTGFIHSGWQQYRKYYDDHGGYHPTAATPISPNLGRDLYLDIGKAWVDFGLTLPDLPRMTLGYEYDYKRGSEATTSWGSAGAGATARNIAPTSKYLDEGTHIIKFDLDADVKGVTVEERFRGEFYHLNTAYTNLSARGPVGNSSKEGDNYFQGANTLRMEKQVTSWFLASGGYLYSKLNATSSYNGTATFGLLAPFVSSVPQITLERESQVANVNGLLGPFAGLTLSLGAQTEWTQQHGFGSGRLNTVSYTLNAPPGLAVNPAALAADYDQTTVMESAVLRYTKIPFSVLFAELRLKQETIGQSDSDLQPTGNYIDNPNFSSRLIDMRAGFSTSPWRPVSLSAHYRRYENYSNYQPNQNVLPAGGYPGFLRSRDLLTDEVETKLAWHPSAWLKTTLTYQYLTTHFWSDTQIATATPPPTVVASGGSLLAGKTDAQVYSVDTMWIPAARWYLDAMFLFEPSKTTTAAQGFPAVVPFEGNTYSVIANGTYVLDEASDLFAGYVFSKADFGQDNAATSIPVGIDYQMHGAQVGLSHRFNKYITSRLQYQFNYYEEPTSGGAANYRAHTIFASVAFRMP